MTNPSPMGAPQLVKFPLDDERMGMTRKFAFDEENKGYFTINTYADGTPGELVIWMNKVGDFEHGFASAWAIAISMLLQYGVDPREIYSKFKYMQFEPSGITGVQSVPMAQSLVDLIMKYMEKHFPPTKKDDEIVDEYSEAVESV